ncbi:MAG: BlaI/MecI/CopY family transcriptional regulator [Eubacteriales bacterium]|nr:BlaI/MecI/CopY family transcriptional regulator [Eubacteriales bacterium]MDD4389356.1 BlaI/MecI/CopY family transcriptional regulator [Eubacteriales bacterium]
MKKNTNISEAEWKIMKVLWEEPMLTLKQITERIEDSDWSYTTIRTMVGRLAEKGVISADKSTPNNFKYYPMLQEDECKRNVVKKFMSRVFDDSILGFVASFSKGAELSDEEKKELIKIIDKM